MARILIGVLSCATVAILHITGSVASMPLQAHHMSPVYSASSQRGNSQPVIARQLYDYAPTVMLDGVYRMWWCGGIAGDHIFYSQATSLGGPWSTPQIVFYPRNNLDVFDRTHVCDPSVIRVNGVYYMYYGGQNEPVDFLTRIGVATSTDGIAQTVVSR